MPRTRLASRPDRFQTADLRRNLPADEASVIADRAEWCLPEERALIDAMYRQGLNATQIAQLRSVPVRVIRRRIRAVVTRVTSHRFVFVMRHRDQWPPTRRRVATACILQGRSFRQAATHLRISLHTVRRQMDAVNAMCDADQLQSA